MRLCCCLLLCCLLALPSLAQSPSPSPSPRLKTMMDYRQELGLTDKQIEDIKSTLQAFQGEAKGYQQKLLQTEKEFKALLDEHADLEKIKAKLKESSEIRFQMRYADVVTSRKVESILTPDQLTRWREIQRKTREATKAGAGK